MFDGGAAGTGRGRLGWPRHDRIHPLDELRLTPCLAPQGRLLLAPSDDGPALEPALAGRLRRAFARGAGHGLLRLGAAEVGQLLPPGLRLLARARQPPCHGHFAPGPMSRGGAWRSRRRPRKHLRCSQLRPRGPDDAERRVPDGRGARRALGGDWSGLLRRADRFRCHGPGIPQAPEPGLERRRRDALPPRRETEERRGPFAFLATYTSRLSAHGQALALREDTGAANKERLLARGGALNAQWIPEHLPLFKTHRECLK